MRRDIETAFAAWLLSVYLCEHAVAQSRSPPTLAASASPRGPCAANCTRYGTCNEELGRCDCPRHLTGAACDQRLDPQQLEARCKELGFFSVAACLKPGKGSGCPNGCNRNGACVEGWCHCRSGYYGDDCSLQTGPDGRPAILPDRRYRPRARGPRVYVYELPPRMTSWRNDMHSDRPTARHFLERLLPTGARVADGDSADWFFFPVNLRRSTDAYVLADAIAYVAKNYPWWNATGGGRRHLVIATGDLGRAEAEYVRKQSKLHRLFANMTFVSYWGLHQNRSDAGWRASHLNATDIVLPVYLMHNKMASLGLTRGRHHPKFLAKASPALRERTGPLLFFSGRICGDSSDPLLANASAPRCATNRSSAYSAGIRQLVHRHHWNRTGFFIRLWDKKYAEHLVTSRFCFGPMGGGHGQRQIHAVLAGCVPLVISDGVLEPFEPALSWSDFGVRVAEADIPRLHEILEAITPEEYALKASRLRCAAQHMAFSLTTGALFGESGRFDAFETLHELLRAKAAHPGVPMERLRQADPQLDAFLDCRDPATGSDAPLTARGDSSAGSVLSDVAAPERGSGSRSSGAGLAGTAAQGSGPSTAGSDLVGGRKEAEGRRLCSISPFDGKDPQVDLCRAVHSWPAHGGYMCAYSPDDLTLCPRPWP
ncbi:hypothetical protein HYH03_017894 [Edaphochlamys debaryana]|uniref:EGF-like domain-containing protein n=1 Tax=Edaphochlamys debaryana TaxID=47281 RepID=A0A836BNV7_9CHLO|nr:hypothetical protein HYH03_017894 [Edaphochlamys debaryana]|eukprot:KAG2483237.1 hypothetical protein HYH03_017894 [Edaphochlamys debaryana]